MNNETKIREALDIIGITPKSYWQLKKLGLGEKYVRKLVDLDVISRKSVLLESGGGRNWVFWVNENGRRYLTKKTLPTMNPIAQPRQVQVMAGTYKPPTWNIRAGAEDHQQYQSRGF